jgi:hypothetical protein
MTDDTRDDRYLWDRSGPPDAEIARLETLLAPLGHRGQPPVLTPVRDSSDARRLSAGWPALLALAATLVFSVAGAWLAYNAGGRGWSVEHVSGAPVVDGVPLAPPAQEATSATLRTGKWLSTDAASRARLFDRDVGRIEVDPDTRLQLVGVRGREHRLSLARGTIHAFIWAPPKRLYVDTPSAMAVDLGCAYTLNVDDDGVGLLRVTLGWVGFESHGRESFIPADAVCETRPKIGPGTPRYEDAPPGYAEALALLDFGAPADPAREIALNLILNNARPRDVMTLWHLLSRGSLDERSRVCGRMTNLAPPPAGVSCDAVLRGDRSALDRWWDSLGLESVTWWRLWKSEWK